MAKQNLRTAALDPVWDRIQDDARTAIAGEPLIGGMVHSTVLHHKTLEHALAYRFAFKLSSSEMSGQLLREISEEAYATDPELAASARADIVAVYERDPACHSLLQPLLYFKGYQAVQAYRVGHWLWKQGRKDLAYFIQARVSEIFGIDIHPQRPHWQRSDDRPRAFHCDWRNGCGWRQRLDAAFGDTGWNRQRRR